MAKDGDNWMPLYIADYLADTTHLTTLAHGAYLLLIMAYWRNGPLPNNNRSLQAITRTTPQEWRFVREQITNFFTIQNGFWTHGRIDKEKAKAVEIIEKRRRQTEAARRTRHPVTKSETISVTDIPSPSPLPRDDDDARARAISDRVLALLGNNPNIVNFSRIDAWLRGGADPERDIYPAIRAVLAKKPAGWCPSNLTYFDNPVAEAIATRLKPMPEVTHEQSRIPGFLDRRKTLRQGFAAIISENSLGWGDSLEAVGTTDAGGGSDGGPEDAGIRAANSGKSH